MRPYIHQRPDWPLFTWDSEALSVALGKVRHWQGRILGKMAALGFELKDQALLDTLTLDVLKSSEIEGELLNLDQVRSSVARHLGMEAAGLIPSDRNVDGVVEMMLDATQQYTLPLSKERLFGWHSSLFPSGRSGMYKIVVGQWRDDSTGPMQVVSGALGKEKVHFEAPEAALLEAEMTKFIEWFNAEEKLDPVIKAAVAHVWFVTVHPFDDGNGRMARALTDLLLARADESPQRFYSMSAQIRLVRKEYYDILEKTQKGTMDITPWMVWFLDCLRDSLLATEQTLSKVLFKASFWEKHARTDL
ncbi:MAG: Fic family protein, partial [Cytophagales bacterium]|nr:Fic family protein [Cytophagales bacterium]